MDFLETPFASVARGLVFVLFVGLLFLVLVLLTRRYVRAIGLTSSSKLQKTRHSGNKISSQELPLSATTTAFQLTPLYTTPTSARRSITYLSPRQKPPNPYGTKSQSPVPSSIPSPHAVVAAAVAFNDQAKRTDFHLPSRLPFITPVKIKPVESSPLAQRRRAASDSPQR